MTLMERLRKEAEEHQTVYADDRRRKALLAEVADEIARLREMEKVLRQIAGMKRRTREQRLASACVLFLDSLPNARLQPTTERSEGGRLEGVIGPERRGL